MLCRVAGSFYRIGHLELFSRRTRKVNNNRELKDLEMLLRHIIKRDYNHLYNNKMYLDEMTVAFLKEVSDRFCNLVTGWMSVGYIQSNMNSDNCSIAGITLDYGPFGFMDLYNRRKNFWTGGGNHFSYYNQPTAMGVNFVTLCNSIKPLLDDKHLLIVNKIIKEFNIKCSNKVRSQFTRKLGFKTTCWTDGVGDLYLRLDNLLQKSKMDWTMFWRELSWYPMMPFSKKMCEEHDIIKATYNKTVFKLHSKEWLKWINDWRDLLDTENRSGEEITTQMLGVNPKYIPREWMLDRAYKDALKGDYSTLDELYILFMRPYDDTLMKTDRWYRLTPPNLLDKPGICSMT